MSLDDIANQFKNLSLKYDKHKTVQHAKSDVQKVSSFLQSTCNTQVLDAAFKHFIELNMKNISNDKLLDCVALLQRENARRVNERYQNEKYTDDL
ncbi:hypothetical protein M153_317000316 [Pseudoloma neurophilia]|uniref:Uncharacterized protein n=1 Tax=Pseudoloma neurophilia TaxID=146866 RepID=A0A0R0LYA5_9MICR|nr:hypothetical protein M153_317000316 [Pseudoloma neurophilia]